MRCGKRWARRAGGVAGGLLLTWAVWVQADVIRLNNDFEIEGMVTSETGEAVAIEVDGRTFTFDRSDIAAIARGPRRGLRVGNRPPDVDVVDLNGRRHQLSAYEGHIVVLQFWATWCPFCRQETPNLTTLQRRYHADGVTVLAISVEDDAEVVRRFVVEHDLEYAVALDPGAVQDYGVGPIPTTYVIGREGTIVHRQEGAGLDYVEVVNRLMNTKQVAQSFRP